MEQRRRSALFTQAVVDVESHSVLQGEWTSGCGTPLCQRLCSAVWFKSRHGRVCLDVLMSVVFVLCLRFFVLCCKPA